MKNQYMFFSEQLFDGFDLSEYNKVDILIPKTNIHIYEFDCIESDTCCDDETKAKKLDELTQRLSNTYADTFQIVNSESSQYFCRQIYPLVVGFETKLRYALYISRALFENGNVNKKAFLYDAEKSKKPIEEMDFGVIYESIFTDKNLKITMHKEYTSNLTKADLIRMIQRFDEKTMWHDWVGTDYPYIEEHFLEIKGFRNDVMHNHLVGYTDYVDAKQVLQKAIRELERAIRDKLITNQSTYLNQVDVMAVINSMIKAVGTIALRLQQLSTSEYAKAMEPLLALWGEELDETLMLEAGDVADENQQESADADQDNAELEDAMH